MANVDNPHGFKAVQTPHGGPPRLRKYLFDGGATAIFPGDLVKMSSGRVAPLAASTDEPILGVASNYVAANSANTVAVYVYDDPDQVFEAQHDGTSAVTDINATRDPTITAGDTTRLLSAHEIDTNGTTTNSLQLLSLLNAPDNAEGANARYLVKIAKHEFTKTLT